MCGIAGILRLDGQAACPRELARMAVVLRHRGPDGEGIWIAPGREVGLAHRRLSILDLTPASAQPMHYGGRYTVTFNGEIYNFLELRQDLLSRGHTFRSDGDTEVLLAGYAEYGEGVLDRLDGMFAFAIWDEKEQSLFCARDRFGEKPFFYHHDPGRLFLFASEVKALLAAGVPARVNHRMLFHYLAHDLVENPHAKGETFFAGVARLEPAHCFRIDRGGRVTTRRYWALPAGPAYTGLTFAAACARFRELFERSVARRLRADVAVGTSLSGGLDSSSIALTIRNVLGGGGTRKSFSARFRDASLDEGAYIRLAVAGSGAEPHETWPEADVLTNELDRVYYHQEEPFGSASVVAQWEVMKLAERERVTVLLDGQGADETLGGYLHYFGPLLRHLSRAAPGTFREQARAFAQVHGRPFLTGWRFHADARFPRLMRLLGRIRRRLSRPAHVRALHPDFVAAFRHEPPPFPVPGDLNAALRYATEEYGLGKLLRFADRNSMAFSREVRLPFLSHELVEFVFALPGEYKIWDGWTKRLLRHALADVLPPAITWRADKLGFQPPQEDWMARPEARAMVSESRTRLRARGLLDPRADTDPWQSLMAGKLFDFAGRWPTPAPASPSPPSQSPEPAAGAMTSGGLRQGRGPRAWE